MRRHFWKVTGAAALLLAASAFALTVKKDLPWLFTLGITAYGVTIGSTGTEIADSYAASSTIDFGSKTDDCVDSSAITVTGAAVNDLCMVGPFSTVDTGAWYTCYVSAADAVKIKFCAHGTVDPASAVFKVRVFDP